jgi:polyferredoxin
VVRPRILVYAILLLALISGVVWSINHRVLLRAELLRDRNALYRELPGDLIENVYTLKLINMDSRPHKYKVEVVDNNDIKLFISPEPELQPEQVGNFIVRMQAPESAGRGSTKVDVRFSTMEEPVIERTVSARFLMPFD